MGISTKMWALRLGLLAGLGVSFGLSLHLSGTQANWLWPVLVGLVLLELAGEWWLKRWAWREHARLVRSGAYGPAAALLRGLKDFSAGRPATLALIDLQLGVIDSLQGRYLEARAVYERLLEEPAMVGYRAIIENNLAWSLMHLGVTGRALQLAKTALAEGEARRVPYAGLFRGTYAVGLVLARRCDEALPLLQRVLSESPGDGAYAQAARAFYLGEALAALGRGAEAHAAYQRALREAPQSIWAAQALARLEGRSP